MEGAAIKNVFKHYFRPPTKLEEGGGRVENDFFCGVPYLGGYGGEVTEREEVDGPDQRHVP